MKAGEHGLGLQGGELRLSEYHSGWAQAFDQEAARLRPLLRPNSELEHIGSTAVPALIAKPVLDLAVMLPDAPAIITLEAALPDLGYRFRDDAGASGGRVWLHDSGGMRTRILHLVTRGDAQWGRWLALRDLLRQSPQAREHYAEAKAQAMSYARDRQDYTRLKTATIQRLLSEH